MLITTEAAELVRDYVDHHRTAGSDFLFSNRYGQHLSRNGIAEALHRLASHASVNLPAGDKIELRPHLLRHRHAYKARSVHGDVFAAKRLGHSSLRHLERYAGLSEQEERDLIERM
ncbi:tyrosine-type recombinase/integrase [Bdellovibrionota bacterium FG-1]